MDDKTDNLSIDPDKVLSKLGKFGRYQMWIYFLSNIIVIEMAFQFMSGAFIAAEPPHTCAYKVNDKIPMMLQSGNQSEATELSSEKLEKTFQCVIKTDNATIKCGTNETEFVYEKQFGSTIVSEWDLVCSDVFYAQFPNAMIMIGGIFGALFISQISDKVGRKWTLTVCCWVVAVLGVLSGIAPTYSLYTICRTLIGVATSGMGMVQWVLCCEAISVELRSFSTIGGGFFWTTGYVTLGVIAYYIRSWRTLNIAISVPFFLTISFCWVLPESLHWLVSQGKTEEAKRWIKKAIKFNKIEENEKPFLEDPSLYFTPEEAKIKNDGSQRTLMDIFRSKILSAQTFILCYMWIANTLIYYGLAFFSQGMSGNRFTNFILGGLVEFPAMIGIPFALNWIGRRWCTMGCYVVSGVSLLSIVAVQPTGNVVVLNVLSLLGKFSITASFVCLFLYMAEIYPTKVRNVGCGFCSMVGRLGSIIAPYAGGLHSISPKLAPSIFGAISLAGAVICYALPETKGTKLPADVNEVQPGPVFKYCFKRPADYGKLPVQYEPSVPYQMNKILVEDSEEDKVYSKEDSTICDTFLEKDKMAVV